MRELGWRRYISGSDGEYSHGGWKFAVCDAMPDVEVVPKESPVCGHAATGEAEKAVKEVKGQVRVSKSSLEEKLQQHVPARHTMRTV